MKLIMGLLASLLSFGANAQAGLPLDTKIVQEKLEESGLLEKCKIRTEMIAYQITGTSEFVSYLVLRKLQDSRDPYKYLGFSSKMNVGGGQVLSSDCRVLANQISCTRVDHGTTEDMFGETNFENTSQFKLSLDANNDVVSFVGTSHVRKKRSTSSRWRSPKLVLSMKCK